MVAKKTCSCLCGPWACGHAYHGGAGWYVAGDDRAGADLAACTHPDPGQYGGVGPYRGVVLHSDTARERGTGHDVNGRAYAALVIDRDIRVDDGLAPQGRFLTDRRQRQNVTAGTDPGRGGDKAGG